MGVAIYSVVVASLLSMVLDVTVKTESLRSKLVAIEEFQKEA